VCRYVNSSLILMLGTLCCVYLLDGDVFVTFILAYFGVNLHFETSLPKINVGIAVV
jgi:hypothetical protein